MNRSTSATLVPVMIATGISLVATAWLLRRVATYWYFFDLGTSGANGFALLVFGAAVLIVTALASAAVVLHARRRGRSTMAAVAQASAVSACLAALLFGAEVRRTRDQRAMPNEAGHVVTLSEYFRAYPVW